MTQYIFTHHDIESDIHITCDITLPQDASWGEVLRVFLGFLVTCGYSIEPSVIGEMTEGI